MFPGDIVGYDVDTCGFYFVHSAMLSNMVDTCVDFGCFYSILFSQVDT